MTNTTTETVGGSFAFKSRTYRRFLYGNFFVRTSDWMDLTILNWIVYEWTQSALALGLLNACRLLPVFFFSLFAGSIADRFDRKKSLQLIHTGLFITALIIALVISEGNSILTLMTIITLRSIFMSFEVPIRNAYLSDIVPLDMLGSAVTLQTTIINIARMIGPAAAGLLLTYFPAGYILIFVSIGPLIGFLTLWGMADARKADKEKKLSQKKTVKETLVYMKSEPILVSILLLAIAPMIFGFPYTTMLPVLAGDLMDIGPDGFGLLLSVSSVGAIISTAVLTWKQPREGGKWLILSSLGFGGSLLLFTVFSAHFIMAFLFMFLAGFVSQFYRTLSRIMVQMKVAEEFRGRVLSIALMDRGFIPLGAILAGFVANSFGAYSAGIFMGAGTLLLTILIVRSNRKLWKE
ncbi:MFS transporter [Bacillus sp. SCS-153A]|uniref:MFS transporter n=1 Tax=Rossellomorea sedimentorum TaxID=3115294 RepID=UPI0039060F47